MTAPKKIMLLTPALQEKPMGGRELLCRLNHDTLKAIGGEGFILFELPLRRMRTWPDYFNAFRGYIDGLTKESVAQALALIETEAIETVFVDGSNLGRFVSLLKRRSPRVEIIVFFHNAEVRFFWGAFRERMSLRALAVMVTNFLAERQAVRWSNKRVCLNKRDSEMLRRVYGRGATHIAPMALEDKRPAGSSNIQPIAVEPFALFVGGTFYANRAGIAWYAEQVAPRVGIKVCVVGRGFEALRQELEIPGKLEVIGAVDDLSVWYARARFVIAPIFDGSGMKTKVAEALMYGKRVIGTPEAFCGYEEIARQVGWMCQTADEFVLAMEAEYRSGTDVCNPVLRDIFVERYSLSAAKKNIKSIVG